MLKIDNKEKTKKLRYEIKNRYDDYKMNQRTGEDSNTRFSEITKSLNDYNTKMYLPWEFLKDKTNNNSRSDNKTQDKNNLNQNNQKINDINSKNNLYSHRYYDKNNTYQRDQDFNQFKTEWESKFKL